ncbi:hypothetical protein EDF46_0096 [Frondihabitans sp. PhB188]|uniref:hypothetical protein n=1 Tax=Frondihabitans sp. PhB188 TaxID=2485200 RepID=UPI000F4850E0|nr:hypothetical protein [Frondihabitans sp. PhB188]ROQ40735.1 hypothetical protein EDF46_0096 [Frondihabitans sp. PhB188]
MDAHVFALVWGPLAIVFEVCFILFRGHISRAARAQRERRGIRVGPNTQSPALMAVGGAVFIAVGIFVLVGVSTGLLG